MILKIYDFKHVSELQDKFNECFPAYRIEFYPSIAAMKADETASPTCLVQDLNKKHDNGELEIMSSDSIEVVCRRLKREFGLHARIFRIQNGSYIPVDIHEHLTDN